ncbi:hypothetical protein F52700_4902 [Fusarium sp. NRRL 52700]|nr:hypothetical protein F52700_4902 [Fusarium sp. NRRL 52700]
MRKVATTNSNACVKLWIVSHLAATMEIQKDLEMMSLDASNKRIADPGQPLNIGLKNLPIELVVKIATALLPIDRASLAFTSSWLHSIIGNALKLNQFDRSEFLRRLERDGMWLSEIFCEICQKFHEPQQSRNFTPREAQRACILHGDPKLGKQSFSRFPPEEINFNIVAALSRLSRFPHKSTVESDFAAHQEDMIETDILYVNDKEDPHTRVEKSMYYSDEDHILIKSQTTLFSGRGTGREVSGILERAMDLAWMLHNGPELPSICEHIHWLDLYRCLIRPEDEFKWRRGQCDAYGLTKMIAGFIV